MPISKRRLWFFRLFAVVVLPLMAVFGSEIILRLAGYGYSTSFFQKVSINSHDYFINNENFTRRFFPPQLMRWPGPVMFEAQKPAHTYRIFILGESAARGEPEPAWAASRYLEALLNARFPATHFEVINLGITAIDSHVILPIARDCARADGDLWIIYMGNNEMVGPFGAATVFGAKATPLPLVRLNLALQQWRVGQLLTDLGRRLRKDDQNASWGGMKMFLGNVIGPDDARKETVYQNFSHNLDDIIRAGISSGAKVLLNTVAVNARDCAPFASLTNSALAAVDTARFETLFAEGCAAQARKNFAGAAEKYSAAAKLDAHFAELQFRWAECLSQMGDAAMARSHFQQACDDDALPFRTDSHLNGIMAAAVKKNPSDKVVFLDAAATLAGPDGLCGREIFYEHVHFNFDGSFRLGRAWAAKMEQLLPADIWRTAVTNEWVSQAACDQRLALTDGNRCAVMATMIDRLGRPPFSGQSNHAGQLQLLRDEAVTLDQRIRPAAARAAATRAYLAAIQRNAGDFWLYENFAGFLESEGNTQQALNQWQRVSDLLPFNCDGYYQTGRLLNMLGQWHEAEAALTNAIALRPPLAEGWYELGVARFGGGRFQLAFQNCKRAMELDPAEAMYHGLAGKALAKLNRHAEAIQFYREALAIRPGFEKLWLALGDELAGTGQFAGAKDAYAQAVVLASSDAVAHLDLGVMLARLGKLDEAGGEFEKTLSLEPGNQPAQEYLNRVHGWQQQVNTRH